LTKALMIKSLSFVINDSVVIESVRPKSKNQQIQNVTITEVHHFRVSARWTSQWNSRTVTAV
jgi:hypothetical protein